jgi:AcrR family transcriptional regulator
MNLDSFMSISSQAVQLTRFARRKEQTRRELLAAAKRVFSAKGYHQAKISDIAAGADVGVGTFYLHYDGKEALFLALVDQTAHELKARIDAAKTAVESPAEQSRVACEALFRFADENRETFRILFGEGVFNQAIRTAQQVFAADIAANVTAGIAAGIFAPHPPQVVVHAVIGLLTQVVSWWITQDEITLDEAVETANALIASGLFLRHAERAGRT